MVEAGLANASHTFALGPKVYRPSANTCLALEHVELQFPWDELRLPYRSLIVLYPMSWANRLCETYGMDHVPEAVMIGSLTSKHLHIWVRNHIQGDTHFNILDLPWASTVEVSLQEIEAKGSVDSETPNDLHPLSLWEWVLKRVTVNLAVLLSHCGTKQLGWANPDETRRHERMRGGRGGVLRLGDLVEVAPAKPIKVFTVSRNHPATDDRDGTNASPRPHWRKGHWRMQAYGERWELHRKIFIPPVFVCGERENLDPALFPTMYEEP
jgi:hypothetical protein